MTMWWINSSACKPYWLPTTCSRNMWSMMYMKQPDMKHGHLKHCFTPWRRGGRVSARLRRRRGQCHDMVYIWLVFGHACSWTIVYASVVVHFQEFLLQCKYDYKHWRYVLAFILHAYLYVLSHPGHDNTHGPECGIPFDRLSARVMGMSWVESSWGIAGR